MIEPKTNDMKDNLKDFPGLGSPIIEEITNFHLIEKKLLGYRDEDEEFENFNAKLRASCRIKNCEFSFPLVLDLLTLVKNLFFTNHKSSEVLPAVVFRSSVHLVDGRTTLDLPVRDLHSRIYLPQWLSD